MKRTVNLTAQIEPFDSFWEAPTNIEKGYSSFYTFYKHNYLPHIPKNKDTKVLVISCGPGYFVNMLTRERYSNVLGIDSFSEKVSYAKEKKLNCCVEEAFPFLQKNTASYDVIIAEQEINHLSKEEILTFFGMVWDNLKENGTLIIHSINGANPITGVEAWAKNFDHYNSFTEDSLKQVLEHCHFSNIRIVPLNLYVFYYNPLNYLGIVIDMTTTLVLRFLFKTYGKSTKFFTKKIAAVCQKQTFVH